MESFHKIQKCHMPCFNNVGGQIILMIICCKNIDTGERQKSELAVPSPSDTVMMASIATGTVVKIC